jgi:large subunit ribosomal protein L28
MTAMARVCELTGVKTVSGQMVSHSNRKTKTRFLPNLCRVTLASRVLGQAIKLRVVARALRSVDKKGGLDEFLLSRTSKELTAKGKILKKKIELAQAKQTINKEANEA